MTKKPPILLVTGGQGRVGGLLRAALAGAGLGGLPVVWHGRRPGPGVDMAWDIGAEAPPQGLATGSVILHLAGRTSGSEDELASNEIAARAISAHALSQGAPLLFMSTAAVYAPAPRDLTEDDPPAPPSAYGRAKLAAEQAARQVMQGRGLTLLRMANLAGADMLFGNIRAGFPITLDPIPGQEGGPLRSYIGPVTLARVLDALVALLRANQTLPSVLNLAQPGAVAMADVLRASGAAWSWGPPRPAAVPRVTLATDRLQALAPLPVATAKGLVAELAQVQGGKP